MQPKTKETKEGRLVHTGWPGDCGPSCEAEGEGKGVYRSRDILVPSSLFFFLRHQRFFLGHLYFCLTDFVRGSEMKPSIISHVLREIHVTDIWNLGFQIATWMKVCNLNEVSQ